MANRYPLIANPATNKIEELALGDNLNLTGNGIVGATTITATQFVGDLVGAATSSTFLFDASNILGGTLNPDRLSGFYNIGVTTANILANASNILTGTISTNRLSGDYNINIVGIASTAKYLTNAGNILDGFLPRERLTGVYDIDITGVSYATVGSAQSVGVSNNNIDDFKFITFTDGIDEDSALYTDSSSLVYNAYTNQLGIGTTSALFSLNVYGNIGIDTTEILSSDKQLKNISGIDLVTKTSLRRDLELDSLSDINVTGLSTFSNLNITSNLTGSGSLLTGIVTTIIAGIGITLNPSNGQGSVTVSSYAPVGKTIYVSQNGNDNNTGLAENYPKRTIKNAAGIASSGDTIKVFPGVYVEDNPIILQKTVSVEGTELRNCMITPQNSGLDLFQVNNGCHITDLSFVGPDSTNGASVVAFQPLAGVSSNRFFDGARMIRMNLDFIAAEAVGYITSTNYRTPAFVIPNPGNPDECKEDIKSIFKCVMHDITRGGNSKCVGAGKSYYNGSGQLQHIVGVATETIDALRYAIGIAHSCINNVSFAKTTGGNYQTVFTQVKDLSMQPDGANNYSIGNCANVLSAVASCVGVVTTIIENGLGALGGAGINTTHPYDYDGQTNNNWSLTKIGGNIYSPGVGPITQGPYIRNCTNFIPKSIGMKVDGFHAEPGDKDDIGVTGSMSVDSYTQYNQGGIGVSITNGAYAQLVSIFTICDDTAIYTASGGQCDITNSNSSFGTYGLVSDGVGDEKSRSIYRHTGIVTSTALVDQDTVVVSGLGNLKPYDGQSLFFGELYYDVESISIVNGGSGYTSNPTITISSPTGPDGIIAEAVATIENGSVVAVDMISSGSQYRKSSLPTITVSPPNVGINTAVLVANLRPLYYKIDSSTKPSSGISTITLLTNLNNTVSAGTTVYFSRLSLQIASSHSFEWVGSGNNINTAKPALGGSTIQANEVVKLNGGEVVYTSTDQSGNFRIGDDVTINQLTGTVSGRATEQNILNTVTPLIIALGK